MAGHKSAGTGCAGRVWRLIDTGPRSGAWNMALDVAIARLLGEGATTPAIHFYEWEPPAVSIGRTQKVQSAVDVEACRADGIDIVRRPTGGRAVFHDGDLTFSIIAVAGAAIPRGVRGSYAVLSEAMARALERIGAVVAGGVGTTQAAGRQSCFASSTVADLTAGGAKLLGSAQRWEGPVLLQQTSLLCEPNQMPSLRYIRPGRGQTPGDALLELESKTVALSDILGRSPERTEIVEDLVSSFTEVLGIRLEMAEPNASELRLARECVSETVI